MVDSNDLSLNVSREILQKDPVIDSMKSALTKRVLDMLEKLAKNEPEQYKTFWKNFGQVLKEGPAEDFGNKEKIAGLLRFASTGDDSGEQSVALADYIGRMKEGQDKIYYLTGESYSQVKNSPHLEVFRKKGIEVLLLTDRIDEWLMSYLPEFDGKQFVDVARGDLDLGSLDSEEDKKAQEEVAKSKEGLIERLKKVLDEQVSEVRVSHRLTDSPAILAIGEQDLGLQMRQILEASGQKVPDSKPIFEINPQHPLIEKLDAEPDEDRFGELSHILFDQAALAAGTASGSGRLRTPTEQAAGGAVRLSSRQSPLRRALSFQLAGAVPMSEIRVEPVAYDIDGQPYEGQLVYDASYAGRARAC